jgi:hypothetical protein
MLSETERQNLISHIETLPQRVEAVVKPLSEDQLNRAYKSGGWSIRQVVHHMADSHMSGYVRMKLVATEDYPILKGYDQVAFAELSDGARMPVENSLSILRGLHARWVTFLRAVPENAWSRKGHHTENGDMTLEELLEDYARHGDAHLAHILSAVMVKPV